LTILCAGTTGTGKSEFVNFFFQYFMQDRIERFQSSTGEASGTVALVAKSETRDGFTLRIIDSPGFGNKDLPWEKTIEAFFLFLDELKKGVHVLFLFDTLAQPRKLSCADEAVTLIDGLFVRAIYSNAYNVITHANGAPPGKITWNQYLEQRQTQWTEAYGKRPPNVFMVESRTIELGANWPQEDIVIPYGGPCFRPIFEVLAKDANPLCTVNLTGEIQTAYRIWQEATNNGTAVATQGTWQHLLIIVADWLVKITTAAGSLGPTIRALADLAAIFRGPAGAAAAAAATTAIGVIAASASQSQAEASLGVDESRGKK